MGGQQQANSAVSRVDRLTKFFFVAVHALPALLRVCSGKGVRRLHIIMASRHAKPTSNRSRSSLLQISGLLSAFKSKTGQNYTGDEQQTNMLSSLAHQVKPSCICAAANAIFHGI